MTALGERYYQGDEIAITHESTAATAVTFTYACGDSVRAISLTNSSGVWSAILSTAKLAGELRYRLSVTVDGTTSVVQAGTTRILPLMSEHRKRAAAIREAIERVTTSPYTSHSFGEMSVSYRNIPELQKAYEQEIALAELEENGSAPATTPVSFAEVYL